MIGNDWVKWDKLNNEVNIMTFNNTFNGTIIFDTFLQTKI